MTEPMPIDPVEKKPDGRSREARAKREADKLAAVAHAAREGVIADEVLVPRRPNVQAGIQPQMKGMGKSARGGVVVQGRDGEILTRTRKSGLDPFDVPLSFIPDGWDYQWNAQEIVGAMEIARGQFNEFQQNGFRAVPASRHDGFFMPRGYTGSIIVRGQVLMERPKQLGDEARAEDQRNARRQMRDRDEALMGARANLRVNVPGGFEMNPQRYRGTGDAAHADSIPALTFLRRSTTRRTMRHDDSKKRLNA